MDKFIVASADFGATNSRLLLREQDYEGVILPDTVFTASTKTTRFMGPMGYLCEDIDTALEELLAQAYKNLRPEQRKMLNVFSLSSHGSSNFICLDNDGHPIFGTPSYDHLLTEKDDDLFYNKFGSPDNLYIETGTPVQPKALSWAKLLFHHMTMHKDAWNRVRYIVPLSSYIAFRLCKSFDSLASEHTHMHNHGYGRNEKGFSSVIKGMGIEELFPPAKKAYEAAGFLDARIAEKYGFSKNAIVTVGGHDSSIFAMMPQLLGIDNAIAVSTGTWDIIMAARDVFLEPRLRSRWLLYNATVDNEPLRTVNLRTGDMRAEYLKQCEMPNDVSFDENVMDEVLAGNDIIMPAYMDGFGPYLHPNKEQEIPFSFRSNPLRFHHALAASLAIQRALAIELASRTRLPERLSLSEFSEAGNEPAIVGGHLAQNYKETNKMTVSMEALRRFVRRPVYRLNFAEPTSVATHVLGVCAMEGKKPKGIKKDRIGFKAEDITFTGDRSAIDRYIGVFEKKLGVS